jgi:endonuclease/exonuclease/phosphatase family metal-dependent hydrolase
MPRLFAQHLGKHKPDLATFQESPGEAVVAEIAGLLGMNHTFFHSGDSWPGAVITRFEIVESDNCPILGGKRPEDLFTRHWGRAVVRAPFGDLVLHSAHLHPGDNEVRTREVTAMLEAIKPDLESGRPVILQGDLNHRPEQSMYKQWTDAGLIDMFAVAGVGPPETIPADKPAARIDYVWAYGPMARRIRHCRVLTERPFRTDPDDPQSWSLSDHLPVLASFG